MKLLAQLTLLVAFGTIILSIWGAMDVYFGLRILGSCLAVLVFLRIFLGMKR